jgi:hypothetical protein
MPFNHALVTESVTTDYTVGLLDDLIKVNTASGAIAVTLPSVGSSTLAPNYIKHEFGVVKTTGDANAVTVSVAGGALINGSATFTLASQYDYAFFRADDAGGYQATSSRLNATFGALVATSATIPSFIGAESHAGIITPVAGIAAAGGFSASPRGIWIGQTAPQVSTDFNNSTPVTTETYVSEIFVPCNMTLTGVALFNGTDVTGNVTVGLATSAGAPITAAKSASTAGSGTDAIQRIPFAASYAAVGPATYYIQVQYSSATARYNTLVLGNHGVLVQTSQTYGTLTSFTPPSNFTANVGNVGGLY